MGRRAERCEPRLAKRAHLRRLWLCLSFIKRGDNGAVARAQDLQRMRLDESCRRRLATGNETVGFKVVLTRPKCMRGERGYVICKTRPSACRGLVGGAEAAARQEPEAVASTVAASRPDTRAELHQSFTVSGADRARLVGAGARRSASASRSAVARPDLDDAENKSIRRRQRRRGISNRRT